VKKSDPEKGPETEISTIFHEQAATKYLSSIMVAHAFTILKYFSYALSFISMVAAVSTNFVGMLMISFSSKSDSSYHCKYDLGTWKICVTCDVERPNRDSIEECWLTAGLMHNAIYWDHPECQQLTEKYYIENVITIMGYNTSASISAVLLLFQVGGCLKEDKCCTKAVFVSMTTASFLFAAVAASVSSSCYVPMYVTGNCTNIMPLTSAMGMSLLQHQDNVLLPQSLRANDLLTSLQLNWCFYMGWVACAFATASCICLPIAFFYCLRKKTST